MISTIMATLETEFCCYFSQTYKNPALGLLLEVTRIGKYLEVILQWTLNAIMRSISPSHTI